MGWHKSSFSNINGCVEVLPWTPGPDARTTGCFQCTRADPHVHVRDSDAPMTAITCTAESWRAFLAGVKEGEFDL